MKTGFAIRLLSGAAALALLAGCDEPLDLDLRGKFDSAFDTSDAARNATANRPKPDNRGIISYPNYQVAVAQRGDTLATVAARINFDAVELARYNGMQTNDSLRAGEVIALPRRVAEPSPATGAVTTGPIKPAPVDISTLAGDAIDSADASKPATAPKGQTGIEPIRHKVVRGETAFTVSRLYNVSVRSLADWNGLGSEFTIREGQYLLIPTALSEPPKRTQQKSSSDKATTLPGNGSPTPVPPSAVKPLPAPEAAKPTASAAKSEGVPAKTPDLSASQSKPTNSGKFAYPVRGKIIREYSKGKNEGIDIAAPAGTAIGAASSGTVAAITSDADQVPIIVVKHPDNLLTVYANVGTINVKKGDKVRRGQSLAKVRSGDSAYVHFEVRKGFESVDPMPYLQ
ncbi:LysM peptidoglycan-binding domain-containing M23 family metallopeptidase [Lentibacter algarum]|uniref:LysM peptidoglycan-binding domain-containing M23 family metallopeptidase n=1 Tax=Lentibacter algarum TaxID=576131 RepID=UPI001C095339|nr:LysM peptidoglycan-binding domain-containing M23 family metallopeptidase [Lentibacter algarum]MBU2982615.1 LysM peptidoglycan-binding domain-containing M23 family metallopeptidase [Lentibacter algarum]